MFTPSPGAVGLSCPGGWDWYDSGVQTLRARPQPPSPMIRSSGVLSTGPPEMGNDQTPEGLVKSYCGVSDLQKEASALVILLQGQAGWAWRVAVTGHPLVAP